jgi:Carboxypeptidase activation peptide
MEFPRAKNSIAKVIVPPHKFADFSELIDKFGIKSSLAIKNLQE